MKTEQFPSYLQIELTNRCNLKCNNCMHRDEKKRTRNLEFDDFKRIIDSLKNLKKISFTGNGETLLLDNFERYIKYCKVRGIYTSLTTNGTLLKEKVENLRASGLDKLIVSFDAATQKTLDKIRPGVELYDLISKIDYIVSEFKSLNTDICASITLSKDNIYELISILQILKQFNLDCIYIEALHHWGTDFSLNSNSIYFTEYSNLYKNIIEEAVLFSKKNNIILSVFNYKTLTQKTCDQICQWPFDSMYVTSAGNVLPCCINIEENEYVFGNLIYDAVEDIWNCPKYNDFRESFYSRKFYSCCKECIYNFEFGEAD